MAKKEKTIGKINKMERRELLTAECCLWSGFSLLKKNTGNGNVKATESFFFFLASHTVGHVFQDLV